MANVALTRHRSIARRALRTCAYPNKPTTLGDSSDTTIGLFALAILVVLVALEWL